MRKPFFILLLALCVSITGAAQENTARAIDRIRFSCEWGYVQTIYHDYHFNILSEEGYRINESFYGFSPHPNGLLLLGAGFVVPAEKLMISIHGGYSGIHEGNRVIAALLRVSFFPRTIQDDGMFYYAQAGAGFHLPAGFKTRVSLMSGLGAGYRIAPSERFSLDLILTAMAAFSHPPVPNPEGPGFVAEQNVRTSDAHYGALSLTIAVNL